MVVAWGNKKDTLYTITTSGDSIVLIGAIVDTELWYNRLSYMNSIRFKIVNISLCENRIFEKQKRVSFSIRL